MGSDSTRWSLIERAADGSGAARAEFARRYTPVIRAYLGARWRRTPLLAEIDDAVQQVFLDCFKEDGALGRADPERGPAFRAFLYGVVRNVALGFERRRAVARERNAPMDVDLDAIAADEESLGQVFDRAWASAVLYEAAELMLERARKKGPDAVRRHALLACRFGDDLPIREIAAHWGVEAKILHREYAKAREEFRRALMDVVRDLSGGGAESVEGECRRLLAHFS